MPRGTIVCGVDDSREAAVAAAVAARVATRLDLRLVLAHVVKDVPSPSREGAESLSQRNATTGATRLLARVAADVGAEGADERVEFGDPAERLAEIATEEAGELVVLGARRHRLAAAFSPGLSARLAASIGCPVLVAPQAPAAKEAGEPVGAGPVR